MRFQWAGIGTQVRPNHVTNRRMNGSRIRGNPEAPTKGYSLMSLTWDGTGEREGKDAGAVPVATVPGIAAGGNAGPDCHLVHIGFHAGSGPGPEIILKPGFNWIR